MESEYEDSTKAGASTLPTASAPEGASAQKEASNRERATEAGVEGRGSQSPKGRDV